jgi:hypothetical protein
MKPPPDPRDLLVSGRTVTSGRFECLACGERLDVDGVTNLPVCPRCQNETWRKR